MDEAERCQRVVYLSAGQLVVQGAVADVVAAAGLVVFEAIGPGIETAARRLRHRPGVETAAVFGTALRVTGKDRAALRSALDPALRWEEVPPRLDDVFIHMLNQQETP
jgi:ABC-2 type transport system ATP-binding protein